MAHMIQGVIGKPKALQKIIASLNSIQLTIEELPQNFKLLFLCKKAKEAIYEQMDSAAFNDTVEPFDFLDLKIKKYLESTCSNDLLAYIETDYFGGTGTQSAGFFKEGELLNSYKGSTHDIDPAIPWPKRLLEEPINRVLRKIGVLRNPDLDEFKTLGLDEYRHMPYSKI